MNQNEPRSDFKTTSEAWERQAQIDREREKEQLASGSIPHLLRQLTGDVTNLFSKEVSLARAEAREAIRVIKNGVVSLLTGGIVLLAGVIVLLMAAVYGLATFMALWLAALIVGGAVTMIGMSMVATGKNKLDGDALTPHRTINSLKEDRDALKGAVKGGMQ